MVQVVRCNHTIRNREIFLRREAYDRMKGDIEKNTGTFVVKILDRQNATWQGSVTWLEEQKVQFFRSALELMKMIDGALDDKLAIEGGNHEE